MILDLIKKLPCEQSSFILFLKIINFKKLFQSEPYKIRRIPG